MALRVEDSGYPGLAGAADDLDRNAGHFLAGGIEDAAGDEHSARWWSSIDRQSRVRAFGDGWCDFPVLGLRRGRCQGHRADGTRGDQHQRDSGQLQLVHEHGSQHLLGEGRN